MASLETCLSALARALPSTKLDLICSLSWNFIRYCLHRPTPLGWLVHQVRGKHEGEEARTSARDAALVYHQLSQLQLTGISNWKTHSVNDKKIWSKLIQCSLSLSVSCALSLSLGKLPECSSLWAFSVSLSAVNLSESAQGKMAPAQLAQIYVTAAIALRTVLGHHLSCLPVCVLAHRLSCDRRRPAHCSDHWNPFLCVCLPGLPFRMCRECGQPVRDQTNPRLPALALHSTWQAVLPQLWLVGEVGEQWRSVHFSERPRFVCLCFKFFLSWLIRKIKPFSFTYFFLFFSLFLAPADPIAQLHSCFCRKLLERAVHTLIQPQSESDAGSRKKDSG